MKHLVRLLAVGMLLFWIWQYSGVSVNGYKSSSHLAVGECIIDSSKLKEGEIESVSEVKTINCQEPHNWQVIYTGETPDNLGTQDSIVAYVDKACYSQRTIFANQFANSLKSDVESMTLRDTFPSVETYNQGNRRFICTVGSDEETTTGKIGSGEVSKTSK